MQATSSRVDNNADVFVPRREIPRTPPRVNTRRQEVRVDGNRVVGGPGRSKNLVTSSSSVEDQENIPPDWLSPSDDRKVQTPCFTPSKSLAHSPPPHRQPKVTRKMTHFTTASPLQLSQQEDTTLGLPEGLVCTDTDLAFLEHKRNVQYHDQLQKQVVSLDKALRTAAEQKEQLQHQAEKVGNHLQDMKQKYTKTLKEIHTLQSTSEPKQNPEYASHSLTTSDDIDLLASELSHTHLSQLQHRQKLMTVQLQKTDQDIQREATKLNQNKQKLQDMRMKESLNVRELDKGLETVQVEKSEWEVKVQKATEDHQKMEKELQLLQSQLELTATPPAPSQPRDSPEVNTAAAEKRAEERLRCLVKRCDLYVKRHHLLKRLRQQQI